MSIQSLNFFLQEFVGGPIMIAAVLLTGCFLTLRLNWLQVRHFSTMLRDTIFGLRRQKNTGIGEISAFQALTTALAGTIGTGNIAGVATAITLGGPGAVFWMWVSAFVGMVTKYAEVVLAVHFRDTQPTGRVVGGPMYFLAKGLNSRLLAALFALFGSLAAFGIGNMVQANSVAAALHEAFNVPQLITGIVMAAITALVIIGGISRVAAFTEKLVPLMAAFYTAGALFIIFLNLAQVPLAFSQIIGNAFTGRAAVGGFAGATVLQTFRFGVARGIFTNEAGLGSASIAHAAARTDHPARQGLWGMFEVFFDTHISCTLTALAVLVTGVWNTGLDGAAMTTAAFNQALPSWGGYFVAVSLVIFAFSTLISWSYYGEKCFEYFVSTRATLFYRLLWIALIPIGAVGGLHVVWALADTLNGLMAIPNLIGLWGLNGLIVKLTREFFQKR
ncbi:MAG TPA: sodium:alanine symporter family protein [Oscillospiraceae bacterium]|nr:sodium:alanine symporter family protein [Oscillospiraceae bacterium]